MSVTLDEIVNLYITRKIANKEWKSEASIRSIKSTMRLFSSAVVSIFGRDPQIKEMDAPLILSAIDRQWPETGKDSTHAVALSRIKAMLTWTGKRGYAWGDIDAVLSASAEIPDFDRPMATREESEKASTLLREEGNIRDASMVRFHFESSRRGGELVSMRVGDIDFIPTSDAPYGYYWHTESKNHRGRQRLRMTETEAEILREWLGEYERILGMPLEDDFYLFPSRTFYGRHKEGTNRSYRLRPDMKISNHPKVFRDAWKVAGVYEPGKAGHANRRGRITEALETLEEMNVANPEEVIMPRSGHKDPKVMRRYVNRDRRKKHSDDVFAQMDAARRQVAQTPKEVCEEDSGNVISFADLARRRRGA